MTLPEVRAGELLKSLGKTVVTAESCTGGLIAHRLTNVSGSSVYLLGGVVAYSNEVKMNLLKVQESTLIAVGAVSEQVAQQMAVGARNLFDADFALSVTGIAGPDGGTDDKPVGLTYIGLASSEGAQVARFVWHGDRESNKESSAEAALQMLVEALS
jgi:PncC family amidohydrolase